MQSITYNKAEKVVKKYLDILTSKQNEHLNVIKVNIIQSKRDETKSIVQVTTNDGNIEDLDNFCLRNDIEYELEESDSLPKLKDV